MHSAKNAISLYLWLESLKKTHRRVFIFSNVARLQPASMLKIELFYGAL